MTPRHSTEPVDKYIKGRTLGAELKKFSDLAEMTDNVRLAQEVETTRAQLAQGGLEKRKFTLSGIAYKAAEGVLKGILEDPREGYITEASMPAAVAQRVLTYDQGVLGVNADATLAIFTQDGVPVIDKKGRARTIHGLLNQKTMKDARAALFLESAEAKNQDLYARLLRDYASQVEELFKPGQPVVFAPKRRNGDNVEKQEDESLEALAEAENQDDDSEF